MNKVSDHGWLSSRSHLQRFASIMEPFNAVPWYRQMRLGPRVPSDFPQLTVGFRAVPIVYFAAGEIRLADGRLEFRAQPHGSTYSATRDDVELNIDLDDLTVFRRFKPPAPMGDRWAIAWIEIDCDAFEEPLLLCSGGKTMEEIAERTDELYERIHLER